MKLKKSWNAVLPGDRYASTLSEGALIPEELESEAMLAGVVDLPKRNSDRNQNGLDADDGAKVEVKAAGSSDFEGLVDTSKTGEQVDSANNVTADETSEVDHDDAEDNADVSEENVSPENGVADAAVDLTGLVDSSKTGEQVDSDNNATADEASELDQDDAEDNADVSGENDSPENGVVDHAGEKDKSADSPNTDRKKPKSKRSKNK